MIGDEAGEGMAVVPTANAGEICRRRFSSG